MYHINRVTDDVVRIVLEKPDGLPSLIAEPTNIYLLEGDAPALVNAGHPSQLGDLRRALEELDTPVSNLERVVYTSWDIEVLGAAASLPNVDHFVFSPDMIIPSDYEALLADRRRDVRTTARNLVDARQGWDLDDLEQVDAFLRTYYPTMPADLHFIPLRSGHTLAAGTFDFEVIATPGPRPGHASLYDSDARTLFGGSFAALGLPDHIQEVQAYIISLERLNKLEIDTLLLTHGKTFARRGGWTIGRALRFFNNFMSTAPAAMRGGPTVVEFIERDLGYPVENLAELVIQFDRYKPAMDELVRARMIEAAGSGLGRRYGVDVEDSRAKLRP